MSLEPPPHVATVAIPKLTSHLDSWATNLASASFSMVASVRILGYGGSRHPLIMADFRETRKNLRGRQISDDGRANSPSSLGFPSMWAFGLPDQRV